MLASLFLAAVAAPSGDSATAAQISAPTATPQHGVAELALFVPEHVSLFDEDGSRPHLLHPFVDAALSAEFVHAESGARSAPNGFYDGAGTFRVRFSPPLTGRWTWATHSAVEQLAGHSGELVVAASKNPGCPKTSPGKMGFVYPDGSAYTPVGTTCYSWVHQDENGAEGDPDALEQNTLEHLKNSPFNKVRMTGFPKWCVRTRASSCRCAQASRRVSGLTARVRPHGAGLTARVAQVPVHAPRAALLPLPGQAGARRRAVPPALEHHLRQVRVGLHALQPAVLAAL